MITSPVPEAESSVVSHLPDQSRFVVDRDGDRVGVLDYDIDPAGVWHLTHTVVRPDVRGQGLAALLVAEAFAVARRDGVVVHPVCPYVVTWLARNPGWTDMVV